MGAMTQRLASAQTAGLESPLQTPAQDMGKAKTTELAGEEAQQ